MELFELDTIRIFSLPLCIFLETSSLKISDKSSFSDIFSTNFMFTFFFFLILNFLLYIFDHMDTHQKTLKEIGRYFYTLAITTQYNLLLMVDLSLQNSEIYYLFLFLLNFFRKF